MKKLIIASLSTLALAAGGAIYISDSSRSKLDDVSGLVKAEAKKERANTLQVMARVKAQGEADLVHVSLSAGLIGSMLHAFEGTSYRVPSVPGTLFIESLQQEFENGYPRVVATLRAEVPDLPPERLQAEACLNHVVSADGTRVDLQVRLLGVKLERSLPRPILDITSARAVSYINSRLEPFRVPLPVDLAVVAKKTADHEMELQAGGSLVKANLALPALPDIQVRWRLLAIWFAADGFHAAGRISADGKAPTPLPEVALSGGTDLDEELKYFTLPAGTDFHAQVPVAPLQQIAAGISTRPEAERTITLCGKSAHGDLISKKGGAPFGNGFRAWLHDMPSVSATASNLLTTVREHEGLDLSCTVAIHGSGSVHAHGNAPRVFGRNIGGGIGATAGVSASAKVQLQASMRPDAADGSFVLRLAGPEKVKVTATVHLFGSHDISLDAPLPVGKEFYRFELPKVIEESFAIDMPKGLSPAKKEFSVAVNSTSLSFGKTSFDFGGKAMLTEKKP